MNDDQYGTAVVTTAALISASRMSNMDIQTAVIGQIGLGSAGLTTCKMPMSFTQNQVLGIDLFEDTTQRLTKAGGKASTLEEIMSKADIVIAPSSAPGLIKPEMEKDGQIILALSNPAPKIQPQLALEAGAAFAADVTSVNNILGFPGILRAAVDTQVPYISYEMYITAAKIIASLAPEGELVPNPLNKDLHQAVA